MVKLEITVDNSKEAIAGKNAAVERALEKIGGQVEKYAKALCPVDTGALRNSITHMVEKESVAVGSGMEYAPYVELGTGKYYTPPPAWIDANGKKGRGLDSWVYQDEQGNWHRGFPMKARPYLRPAVENHLNEFEGILKQEMKG